MSERLQHYFDTKLLAGKDQETRFLEAYFDIRDLHFDCGRLPEKPRSVSDSNRILETYKRGSCTAKHYLLGSKLETLGFETRYLTFPFKWGDIQVSYPQDLKELADQMPIQYHCALGLMSGDQGHLLDVTWDRELSKAGFVVNELLADNGQDSLGVVPCGETVLHQSAQQRWDYIQELKMQMPRHEIVPIFYTELNQWLQSLRD